MDRRLKGSSSIIPPPQTTEEGHEISQIVDGLLDVLRRYDAEPTEGVLALLTALLQAADRVMEASTPEETEHNRAALLSMMDHGHRMIAEWPRHTPETWSVH
jgi:hypothetical protein